MEAGTPLHAEPTDETALIACEITAHSIVASLSLAPYLSLSLSPRLLLQVRTIV